MEVTRSSGSVTTYMGGVGVSYRIRRASKQEGRSVLVEESGATVGLSLCVGGGVRGDDGALDRILSACGRGWE